MIGTANFRPPHPDASDAETVSLDVLGRSIQFTGDERDGYFKSLSAFHQASPHLQNYATQNLPRDAICLDVGANIGLTSITVALACPDGHVYAFEPSPRSFRHLERNIEQNKIRNITAIRAAVGASSGDVLFNDTEYAAGAHVVADAQAHVASVVRVRSITIDEFLLQERCTSVALLKVDAEGFEPDVIAGARTTLITHACPVFMEFNSWCLQALHDYDAWSFARALHKTFDVYNVDASGRSTQSESAHALMYGNLVKHQCVEDIVVRLKPGCTPPTFAEMTKPAGERALAVELEQLRADRRMWDGHLA